MREESVVLRMVKSLSRGAVEVLRVGKRVVALFLQPRSEYLHLSNDRLKEFSKEG